MTQYIPKDALVAEIERRRDLHYKYYMKNGSCSIAECKYDEDMYILSFLDTLEMKEVDLEKSISDWLSEGLPNDEEEIDYIKETAKHFFELGIKAQKGE